MDVKRKFEIENDGTEYWEEFPRKLGIYECFLFSSQGLGERDWAATGHRPLLHFEVRVFEITNSERTPITRSRVAGTSQMFSQSQEPIRICVLDFESSCQRGWDLLLF